MKTSEKINNLTKALLKAQTEMGSAKKNADNPFFKSKYAGLPEVMEVVKGPLNNNGLAILQPGFSRDGKNFISTVILHADTGEFISSETEVVVPANQIGNPQAHGSAQTYARRFGLQSMLFIPAEDKDGEDLMERNSGKTTNTYTPKAKTETPKMDVTAGGTSPTNALVGGKSLNPAQELANDPNPVQTVQPLKASSFRNKKGETASTSQVNLQTSVQTTTAVQASGDWS